MRALIARGDSSLPHRITHTVTVSETVQRKRSEPLNPHVGCETPRIDGDLGKRHPQFGPVGVSYRVVSEHPFEPEFRACPPRSPRSGFTEKPLVGPDSRALVKLTGGGSMPSAGGGYCPRGRVNEQRQKPSADADHHR